MALDRKELIVRARKQQQVSASSKKERHDNKIKPVVFKVKDLVLVKKNMLSSTIKGVIKKVFSLFNSYFKEGHIGVREIKLNNAYVLEDPNTREKKITHNIVNLKPYPLCE